ncbi:proline-rich extensin-like protein EPR1 isoform X1 [Anguilla anguilla]|uniref:proline-rich extensin-like protein EPR1 isoform X1 n=1 Tax=Anguilla anguilla TaxID=7936 RepID=UPI0015AC0D5A|nr:proline-rich extensin-like protein EPR1 isoform X1 [Anguilla anguilla]
MKKGTFSNFLGRKNHSLFDTNIEIKERDNVELVLDSSAIPESGTAKVRARPTVKHFTSSTDIMQGFAVPTPKVPVLSTFGVPNTNGTGGKLSNGVSVPDLAERDIFIPPPPSMAPPPPPPSMAPPPPPSQLFIPPPADFSFESPPSPVYEDPASLQPPPMPPPKPPSKTPSPHSSWVPDHTSLKPPPMTPPKPPSNPSSAKVSAPISTALNNGPECPKFAPPKPPASAERPETPPPKGFKVPPPKPTRLSSMFQDSQDNLPHIPAPARPAPGPTASTFNPQHTAKLYTVPKAGILATGGVDLEKTPKPILLLQDTSTDPIPTQLDGKMPSDNKDLGSDKIVVPPTKPARKNSGGLQLEKDLQGLKESLQSTLPAQAVKVQEDAVVTPLPLQPPQELKKPTQPTPTASPIPENTPPTTSYANSPGRSRKLIPYVSRTPYYLRPTESSTPGATSPLALLQAAKEREKQRGALSRENSSNSNIYSQPTSVSIHQNQSTPNSFTVVPRPTSSLSQGGRDSPDLYQFSRVETDSACASPSRPLSSSSLVAELLEKHDAEAAPAAPDATLAKETKREEAKEDVSVPFIPPPPEFANSDAEEESGLEQLELPPSFPPPDPPSQKVPSRFPTPAVQQPPIMVPPTPNPPSQKVPSPFPTPAVQHPPIMVPPTPNPPSQKVPSPSPTPAVQSPRSTLPLPPPKPKGAKPPNPPQLPVQKTEVKPKPPSQDKLKPQPPLPPAQSLSPSQATLLSILQKKMLEMDKKHTFEEVQPNNDDWGTSEEPTVPVKPSPIPKFKSSSTLPRQNPGLDMSELEQKVSKKAQDLSAATKSATSNGSQSKQPYGMTFTVRPGTKQPIMPVIKGDAP